jgi:hypothetical protein
MPQLYRDYIYTVKPLYYVHARDQKISLYLLTRSRPIGKHLKRFNIVDSDICKLCNVGIQDREHLRSYSILQDKLSDIDNFENMTKTEKESVCYWLARSMMA